MTVFELFNYFDQVLMCFAHGFANRAAHELAMMAYSLTDFQEWYVNVPEFLSDVIFSESL